MSNEQKISAEANKLFQIIIKLRKYPKFTEKETADFIHDEFIKKENTCFLPVKERFNVFDATIDELMVKGYVGTWAEPNNMIKPVECLRLLLAVAELDRRHAFEKHPVTDHLDYYLVEDFRGSERLASRGA